MPINTLYCSRVESEQSKEIEKPYDLSVFAFFEATDDSCSLDKAIKEAIESSDKLDTEDEKSRDCIADCNLF